MFGSRVAGRLSEQLLFDAEPLERRFEAAKKEHMGDKEALPTDEQGPEFIRFQQQIADSDEEGLEDYELLAGIVLSTEKFKPQEKRPEEPKPEAVFEIYHVDRD